MLDVIPIEPSWIAIIIGVAVVAAAAVLGYLFSRREVKKVDPHDTLRGP